MAPLVSSFNLVREITLTPYRKCSGVHILLATQNSEVNRLLFSASCLSELALEEICRSEGDDTDDMDTETGS